MKAVFRIEATLKLEIKGNVSGFCDDSILKGICTALTDYSNPYMQYVELN